METHLRELSPETKLTVLGIEHGVEWEFWGAQEIFRGLRKQRSIFIVLLGLFISSLRP